MRGKWLSWNCVGYTVFGAIYRCNTYFHWTVLLPSSNFVDGALGYVCKHRRSLTTRNRSQLFHVGTSSKERHG